MMITPTASHARYARIDFAAMMHVHAGKGKGKEEYLYSAIYILCISPSAQAWITQFYLQIHHACLYFVSVHQMLPHLTEVGDIQLQLNTHLLTLEWMKGLVCLVC